MNRRGHLKWIRLRWILLPYLEGLVLIGAWKISMIQLTMRRAVARAGIVMSIQIGLRICSILVAGARRVVAAPIKGNIAVDMAQRLA